MNLREKKRRIFEKGQEKKKGEKEKGEREKEQEVGRKGDRGEGAWLVEGGKERRKKRRKEEKECRKENKKGK